MVNWGDWSNECVDQNTKKYFSRLWNIDGNWDDVCAQQIKNPGITNIGTVVNTKCINKGISGMWGEVYVQDDCSGTWGTFKNECDEKGFKKFYSQLSVPGIVSWEDACAKKISSVQLPDGTSNSSGNCVKKIEGMYGEWIVPDKNCTQKTSAALDGLSIIGNTVDNTVSKIANNTDVSNLVNKTVNNAVNTAVDDTVPFQKPR
jgi:hypothetical protein